MMNNSFKIQGIIAEIGQVFLPIKGKDYCKREFILEFVDDNNVKHFGHFTLINQQIRHITNMGVGYEISFHYSISCRPWLDKEGNHMLNKYDNKFYFQELIPCWTGESDELLHLIKIHEDRLEVKKEENIPEVDDDYFQEEEGDLPF